MEILNLKVKNKKNKKQAMKGFTLLEVMVAVTIFSILSLFVLDLYVTLSRLYIANYSIRSAQQNVRNAVETVSRYAKQTREVEKITEPNELNGELHLRIKDDLGVDYRVRFYRECQADPYSGRRVFDCDGSGNFNTVGVIKMAIAEGNNAIPSDYEVLTSSDLNVTKFQLAASPGVPMILKVTVSADMEEKEKGWERGVLGTGEITMATSVILRGQYY